MDINTAIEKLFHIYQKIDQTKNVHPGFGDFYLKYPSKVGSSFLYVLMSPPKHKYRGKKKDLDKLLNKSAKSNRVILPKDFDEIVRYLYQIFPNLIKSRNEILKKLEEIIAGLRLQMHIFHNLKFEVKDPSKSDLIVYEDASSGEYWMYINLVGYEETGLVLAHERQIEFIRENLKKGIDPRSIQSLPPLRTGETEIDFSQQKSKQERRESEVVQKFREKLKQKKVQGEVEEELAFETVIDFSKQNRQGTPSIQATNSDFQEEEIAPVDVKNGRQVESLDDERSDIEDTKIVKESDNAGVSGNLNNSPSNIPPVNVKPYIDIPKPAPLSKDSVLSSEEQQAASISPSIPDQQNNALSKSLPPPLTLEEGVKLSTGFTVEEVNRLKEENELLKTQLEQVTDTLTRKMAEKDDLIEQLNQKNSDLTEQNQNLQNKLRSLQESYENLQKNTQRKMENFRQKVQKIQEQIKPLIKENKLLKAKWENEIRSQKVDNNIELINQNLALQEKIEQLTQENTKYLSLLKKIQQNYAKSSNSPDNNGTSSELQDALLNSLQKKHKELSEQQNPQDNGK